MTRSLRTASLLLLIATTIPMLFLGQRTQSRIPGQWFKSRDLREGRAGACTDALKDGLMLTTGGQSQGAALNIRGFN